MANGSCSLIKERRVGTNKERLVSSTAVGNKSVGRNEPGKLDDTAQFPSLRVRKRLYVKGNNFQLLSIKDHETGSQLLHYLFFSEIHTNKGSAKLTCVLDAFSPLNLRLQLSWQSSSLLSYWSGVRIPPVSPEGKTSTIVILERLTLQKFLQIQPPT